MELTLTKRFLLACQEAKTIVERQPRLPQGMRPGHVRVLDTLHQLSLQQGTGPGRGCGPDHGDPSAQHYPADS